MRNPVFRLLTAIFALTALLIVSIYTTEILAQEENLNDTREAGIVRALATALNEGDVDRAMRFIAEDAYFSTSVMETDVLQGKEAIRGLFEELVASDFRIETNIVGVYDGGKILISDTQTWSSTMPSGIAPLNATEMYVLDGREVTGITWIIKSESLERLAAAMAPPVTEDYLVGIWRERHGLVLEFFADGTYRIDANLEGDLNETLPRDSGIYMADDHTLTWVSGEDTRYCNPDDTFVVDVTILDEDTMEFSFIEAGCDATSPGVGTVKVMTRIR